MFGIVYEFVFCTFRYVVYFVYFVYFVKLLKMLVRRHRCRWAIHPQSKVKIFWDMLGTIFILYDVVFLPLILFGVREPFLGLAWLITFFWTIDM